MFIDYEGVLKKDVNWFNDVRMNQGRYIGNISGGAASAIACQLMLEEAGDLIHLAFCDTSRESPDTYRFLNDFERVLGVKIHFYKSETVSNPEEVWRKYKGLNFAKGAPCSSELKREVRKKQIQDLEHDYCQIFGFDFSKKEIRRAAQLAANHTEVNPRFPLIEHEVSKAEVFHRLKHLGIEPPQAYKHFNNNNCIGADDSDVGGCVQGGIGYWQLIKELYPLKFDRMAALEHEFTDEKGEIVHICKDQSFSPAKPVFLKKHPDYPDVKCVDEMKWRRPVPDLPDCFGVCGERSSGEEQLVLPFIEDQIQALNID